MPDAHGRFVVFSVSAFVMIQVAATNLEPADLDAVIASIDEDALRAFDDEP